MLEIPAKQRDIMREMREIAEKDKCEKKPELCEAILAKIRET
jgi:hypothetical protein